VGCVGVFWNAPYEGPGECTAFSDLSSVLPANEVGGVQEAALVVYGPAGETYATPRPYTASSTTAPPATGTETATSTPEPTLGTGDEFYIAVTAELPRVKRAIYYIAIGLDGFAVLVTDFAEASLFTVDENGALISKFLLPHRWTVCCIAAPSLLGKQRSAAWTSASQDLGAPKRRSNTDIRLQATVSLLGQAVKVA
jgi:hypothetical protein